MTDIRDKYWALLDASIQINEELINLRYNSREMMGAVAFSKELATMKSNIGRQMGTTTYIAKNASEKDCVICLKPARKDEFNQRSNQWRITGNPEILSIDNLHPDKEKYNKVWVDGASVIDKGSIQEIYEKFSHRTFQFIFLG